jgi:hypothetical protein
MSIGTKNQKCYLEIEDLADGFAITATKRHAAELEPLFGLYGIPCARETGAEGDAIIFPSGVDRRQVEEILVGYQGTTGS